MRGLFDGGRLFLNTNTGGGLIITDTLTFTRFQLQYFRSWNHHDLNISLKNDDMSAGGAAAAEAAGEDSLDAHAAQALPPAPTAPPSPCRHRHAPGYASYSTSRRRSLPRRTDPAGNRWPRGDRQFASNQVSRSRQRYQVPLTRATRDAPARPGLAWGVCETVDRPSVFSKFS